MDKQSYGISRRNVVKGLMTTGALIASPSLRAASSSRTPSNAFPFLSADDITNNQSALRLSHAIKRKEVSCVEVMNAYLNHIETYNPALNAIVALQDRDQLIAQAKTKDSELAKGIYHGWMHGFPHAVKDLAATKGIVTSVGSPILKNWVPDSDALFVERIKKAGAIIVGKTNIPEFALGSQSYNPVYGVTASAYAPDKTAGGSSGGAAAALAANFVPVADGSDMMGSLRNPAAFNNVVGFRPTSGRIPALPNQDVFVQQLGYEGPMGRNVRDTAMLLSTMAGYDSGAPLSLSDDPAQFAGSLDTELKGKRVAWLDDFNGYLAMEPGVIDVCEKALTTFDALGVTVEAIKLDFPMETLWQTWLTHRHWLMSGLMDDLYQDPEKRAQLKPELIWEIEGGHKLSALDVFKASKARSQWYQVVDRLLTEFDALVLPSAQVFPFDKSIRWPKHINGKEMDTYHRWMEVVIGGTLSGCPVVNVPAGFNEKGLPMGIQMIGKNRQDFALLQLAHGYESAFSGKDAFLPKLVS